MILGVQGEPVMLLIVQIVIEDMKDIIAYTRPLTYQNESNWVIERAQPKALPKQPQKNNVLTTCIAFNAGTPTHL